MLQIDVDDQLKLQPADFIGQRVAVLGTSGNGKSNTVAVLVEELASTLPMTIVDMESEYWSLREQFDFLVVGKGENVDLEATPDTAGVIAAYALERGISVILDMLEFSDVERDAFLLEYFQQVWKIALKARKPHLVILEECHEFIPQGTRSPLKDIITRIALRGRKRGLGIILASQRTAMVEKDILTQAKMLILHQVDFPTDVKVYQSILPQKPAATEAMINDLVIGKAIVRRKGEDGKMKIDVAMMRKRHTQDVGATPGIEPSEILDLRKVDRTMLDDLRKAMQVEVPKPTLESLGNAVQLDLSVALETAVAAQKVEMQQMRTRYASMLLSIQMERSTLKKQLAMADDKVKALQVQPVVVEPVAVQKPMPKLKSHATLQVEADDFVERRIVTTKTVETFRSSRSMKMLVTRQQNAFDEFMQRIQNLRPIHRRVLALALDEEKTTLSINKLIVNLDYSYDAMRHALADLFGMGLLLKLDSKTYQSYIHSLFRQRYENLNQDELIDQLWDVIEE